MPVTMPVLFVSHGAPTVAVDPVWGDQLAQWGRALPRPRAYVVVSAHWRHRAALTGVETTQPLIYDFSGFPRPLYDVTYPAPGSAEIAARVRALTGAGSQPDRGLDHGVWVPLVHLAPDADIPVVQCALPWRDPSQWWELGRALAPLRAEGVVVIGSGGIVHNLGRLAWHGTADTEPWAVEFDAWVTHALEAGQLDDIRSITTRAPHLAEAHPVPDHLAPLVVATAAAAEGDTLPSITFPITGFDMGNLGMRSIQFG
jgi:4,5-DOPA dioxygenase extradiol